MVNDKIVVIINVGKKLEDVVGSVQSASDEALRSQQIERLAASIAGMNNGHYIGLVDGSLILEMPVDGPDAIEELYRRINTDYGAYPTIGIGEDSKEAKTALDYALKHKPGSIKVFGDALDESSSSEQLSKSDKYESISDKDKKNIAKTLVAIDENKELFESLKEQQPEVYSGIVSVIQSIAEILAEDKKRQEEEIVDTINKINEQDAKEKDKRNTKDSKEIDKEVGKQSKKLDESKTKEMNAILEALHNEYAMKRKEAMSFMKNEPEDEELFKTLVESLFE